MSQVYDAVVVGGGHNGLVCAAYLARAGLKVIVIERREVLGGACVTEEVWPGYRVSTASYVVSLLQPRIIDDLELTKLGFQVLPRDNLFVPFPDGSYFAFRNTSRDTCAEIAKFSRKDAEAYPAFDACLHEGAKFIRELLWLTPPNPTSRRIRDLKAMFALLWKVRRLGSKLFRLADLMTESIADFLDHFFESDRVKAVLATGGATGTFAGPRTPGTAYVLLHHRMAMAGREGEHLGRNPGTGYVRGGMGAISQAIARSAQRHGATIRTGASVARIVVKGGRATGVALDSGEEIGGKVVVSNADPKRTFLRLVDAGELPPEFVREVRALKTYSSAFKVNLALDEPPCYTAFDAEAFGARYATYAHISPSIEYLERAYDDAKYGRPSANPWLSALLPTIADPDLAPEGKHILSVFGGHAPYALKEGTWDTERERFGETVLDTLGEYAPNLKSAVIDRQVLVPPDLESIFALPQGNIFHGELSLDQLFFMRPVPGYADYRSPIRSLYQCGSGTHPGGGVMGVPGYNAAREILRDWRS